MANFGGYFPVCYQLEVNLCFRFLVHSVVVLILLSIFGLDNWWLYRQWYCGVWTDWLFLQSRCLCKVFGALTTGSHLKLRGTRTQCVKSTLLNVEALSSDLAFESYRRLVFKNDLVWFALYSILVVLRGVGAGRARVLGWPRCNTWSTYWSCPCLLRVHVHVWRLLGEHSLKIIAMTKSHLFVAYNNNTWVLAIWRWIFINL